VKKGSPKDQPPGFGDMTQRVWLADDDMSIGIGDDGLITLGLRKDAVILVARVDPDAAEGIIQAIRQAVTVIRAREAEHHDG
jgi:hypothetical protein